MLQTNFPTQQQMNAFGHFLSSLVSGLPHLGLLVIMAIAAVIVLVFFINLTLRFLDMQRLLAQKTVFLELTPPAFTEMKPATVEKLYAVLHGLKETRPWIEKLLQRKATFSLEITGTLEQGIRYIARVPAKDRRSFERDVTAHVQDVRVREVEDYLTPELDYRNSRVLDFKQTGHFAYPLKTSTSFTDEDFVAYVTTAMTQLKPDEQIVFQIVASPATVRATNAIRKKIINNEHLMEHLGKKRGRSIPMNRIFYGINSVLFGITGAVGDTYHGSTTHGYKTAQKESHDKSQAAKRLRPARTLSAFELELVESVNRKVEQPLFRANVRALIVMKDKQSETERANDIRNSLGAFTVPNYQSLKARYAFPSDLVNKYRFFRFKHRLPAFFNRNACVLSVSELSSLYHFPNSRSTKTENVVTSLSKTLSAPLSLKNHPNLDVLLGQNHHHGTITGIGLTAHERERHMFIVGGTGNGKTTLMKYAIIQDMQNGKGIAVIDPHGELAQELLAYIPEDRINDVIYFNPSDLHYPIGLNILEIPEGLTGDELLDAKDFIAETIVSIMRKTFSDDASGGHRIEYVLRNAVLTALTVKDATLFTVYDLLTNKDYRKPIVEALEQDWLRNFWKNEFSKAGDYQQVKMMAGVTSKIGRYHASVSAERILSQAKSTISFDEILDGKILICNLAKGLIGEDTSEVLGISVLAELQLASFRRIKQKKADRKPFYAYVDEFQNFATTSFVEMLSESRKYMLFLTMAEQTTSQQDDEKMVNTILTNAGTIICFKSNSLADEKQMLHLFDRYIDKGAISNLPAYNFYTKLSGGLEPQEPLSGKTVVLEDEGSEEIAEQAIEASRANYAKEYVEEAKKNKTTKTSEEKEQDQDEGEDDQDIGDGLPVPLESS